MKSEKFIIYDKSGMHMRLAAAFAGAANGFECEVSIIANGSRVNGKSVIEIMAACIKYKSEITVRCSGNGENSAIEKLKNILWEQNSNEN